MVVALETSVLQHHICSSAGFRAISSTRNVGVAIPQFSDSVGRLSSSRAEDSAIGSRSRFPSQLPGPLTLAGPVFYNPAVGAAAIPVKAAIAETGGRKEKWWEQGKAPNMLDVHSTQEFLDALSGAGDRLVVVEFFASWCGSCKALYPAFCKLVKQYSDVSFVKVEFEENKPMCKSLNIKVLPFFHMYKGAAGKLEAFSCSLSKIQKLKDAIALHYGEVVGEGGIDLSTILQGEDLSSLATSRVTVLDTKSDSAGVNPAAQLSKTASTSAVSQDSKSEPSESGEKNGSS